jgi:hypothetical protein
MGGAIVLRSGVNVSILLVAGLALTAGMRFQQGVRNSTALGAIQARTSPDGSSIAVSYQGAIWRMPREGGEMRRLTAAQGFDSNPPGPGTAGGSRTEEHRAHVKRQLDAAREIYRRAAK